MWPVPERYNAAEDFISRNVKEGLGNNTAIIYGDQMISYAELNERVNQAGNLFKEMGVEMEQRVFICLPDCPELIVSFYGAMKIGAVPVPLNPRLKPDDYAYFVNDGRPKVLITDSSLIDTILSVTPDFNRVPKMPIFMAANCDEIPKGWVSFNKEIEEMSANLEPADTHKDDVALWVYSSGSTGKPKGTVHLHHDIPFCFEHFGKNIINPTPEDRFFSVAKMNFAYGLGNSTFYPFGAGAATIIVPEHSSAEVVLKTINEHKPTVFFTVPTSYNSVLRHPEINRVDLSSIRLTITGGEPSSQNLLKEWREWTNSEIIEAIGSTEALHIYMCNRPGNVKMGSTGKVVPGFETMIVDENDNPVAPGEIGDLLLKGDSIAVGYWNKHEKTKETFLGSWMRTGDKFRQDEEGFFWFEGRSDDMIKSSGLWVSPAEVENVLMEHPAVVECAVVAHDVEEGLIKPKAFISPHEDFVTDDKLIDDIKNFVKQRLAHYKCPHLFEFVSELPKTNSGKIQRFRLRKVAEKTM